MAGPEAPTQAPIKLYNEAYSTQFGHVPVKLSSHESLVHDTNNLDSLIDAYFREGDGELPRNLKEQVAAAKLANPAIHFLLQVFMRLNPELGEQLRILSARRELEYQVEYERRLRIEQGQARWTDLKNTPLPAREESFRKFLYSQVLDNIGDIVTGYGFSFDLEELLE